MSNTIRRRSLPDSLRYLADKLDTDTLPDAERVGVLISLRCLADEIDPPAECWHTEPGSPCDWNICRQPERLTAGDRGTDPAHARVVADPLRRTAAEHCRPGRCLGLTCCSYECSQGRCPSLPTA